jgi:hypothetical protein
MIDNIISINFPPLVGAFEYTVVSCYVNIGHFWAYHIEEGLKKQKYTSLLLYDTEYLLSNHQHILYGREVSQGKTCTHGAIL